MVPSIGCRDLFARLWDDEVVVVDCRQYDERDAENLSIPGALRIPLGEFFQQAHILPEDELIVLCGGEPDGSDSEQAYRMLRMKGREAVCLQGGIPEWIASGFPIEPFRERPRYNQAVSASLIST